jgi:hypothetical protein
MAGFRKKPVGVEAVRLTERTEIQTIEGTMIGNPGDWLIPGVAGEKYPCKGEIFRATYYRDPAFFSGGMGMGLLALWSFLTFGLYAPFDLEAFKRALLIAGVAFFAVAGIYTWRSRKMVEEE